MKRIIAIFALFGLCIGLSLYTIHHVKAVTNIVETAVSSALDAIKQEDQDALMSSIQELSNFWDKEEDRLIYFVRHTQIDDITKDISRLHALAEWKAYAELSAELSSILWQMEHIYRSECEIFANLL